jgi:hypothetical protein
VAASVADSPNHYPREGEAVFSQTDASLVLSRCATLGDTPRAIEPVNR